MGGSKLRKKKLIKELVAEDWCFVCKDGGFVRICDYKQCLKSYHPSCVGKNDSFLDSEDHWTCNWHTCFLCRRSVCRHCYTCAKAVCHRCLPTADFLQVKGKNGFCSHCLKLAVLVEENRDYDSDGKQVDFKDRETYEGLFKEYYQIIKENEGFELRHIYAAKDREKARKNYKSGFGSLELDEDDDDDDEDEEKISDYDGSDHEKTRKRILKSAKKNHIKSNKKEFISWGSRTLIEFLVSIGKSTSDVLSQRDVTDIVNGYILENKLFHSKKRKMVVCDELLRPLLGRRMVSKYRIYDLLEDHFTENHDELEENDMVYDLENTKESTYPVCKRQRKFDAEIESTKNEREFSVPQSVFASISVDNVKLVYVKRSLIYELLKHPESFEEKVIGCFVRTKSDPYDCCAKNSHQLMQVKGIKSVSNGESNTEVVLCFSAFQKEVRISLLSDNDFSEDECADLRQKTLAGLLMKPTVVELQLKARVLHVDLTKHWINKELALLQKLIDRANEKGHRRELFEYLEKRKRLQSPSEQAHLLETFPIVSPEISELSPNSENSIDDVKNDDNSIIQSASTVPRDRWKENGISAEKGCRGHGYCPETKQPLLTRSGSEESQRICIPDHEFKPLKPAYEEKGNRFETCHFDKDSHMSSEETWYEQTGRKSQDASTFEVEFCDYENANGCKVNDLIPVNQKFDVPEGEKTCCMLGLNDENDKNSVSCSCTEQTNSNKAARKVPESTLVGVIELLGNDKNAIDHEANTLIPVNQGIDIPEDEKTWCILGSKDENGKYSVSGICTEKMHSKKAARKGPESTPTGVIELLSDDENVSDRQANLIPVDQKNDILKGEIRWCILGSKDEDDKYLESVRSTKEAHSEKAARKGQESALVGVIELRSDDENLDDDKANSDHEDPKFNLGSKTQHILGQNDKLETYSIPTICSEETQYEPATRKSQESTQIEVIELLSDDENGNESKANSVAEDKKFDNLESKTWCIRGPNGEQEKCSMSMLKRWSEISPYAFKFKVWKEEQKEEDAIWLGEAINFTFSKR